MPTMPTTVPISGCGNIGPKGKGERGAEIRDGKDRRWERQEMGKTGDGKDRRWERQEMGKTGDGKERRSERGDQKMDTRDTSRKIIHPDSLSF